MAKIAVETYEPTDPRLGRHVQHDERSYTFMLFPKETQPKRVNTFWPSKYGPLNQGRVGSCTGNALAQWGNTDHATPVRAKAHGGRPFTEADALNIYSMTTHLDTVPGIYPPTDSGSTGLAACKAGIKLGYLIHYNWLFSFTSTQAALEHGPVMFGTAWTQSMFQPHNGLVKVGPLNSYTIAGGHEFLGVGIDYDHELILLRNSWGDQHDWPGCLKGGYFSIGFKDMAALLAGHGDVAVPVGVA